jgi:hypothetical protein
MHRVNALGSDIDVDAEKFNALFTHRVRITRESDIDAELRRWLCAAYKAAG